MSRLDFKIHGFTRNNFKRIACVFPLKMKHFLITSQTFIEFYYKK